MLEEKAGVLEQSPTGDSEQLTPSDVRRKAMAIRGRLQGALSKRGLIQKGKDGTYNVPQAAQTAIRDDHRFNAHIASLEVNFTGNIRQDVSIHFAYPSPQTIENLTFSLDTRTKHGERHLGASKGSTIDAHDYSYREDDPAFHTDPYNATRDKRNWPELEAQLTSALDRISGLPSLAPRNPLARLLRR